MIEQIFKFFNLDESIFTDAIFYVCLFSFVVGILISPLDMVEDKGKQITEVTYSNVQSVCLDEIVEECLKFTKTRNARISIVELPFTKEKIIKIYTEEKN